MNARWIAISGIAVITAACGADTTEEAPVETAEQPADVAGNAAPEASAQTAETPPSVPETAAANEPAAQRATGEAAAATMTDPAVEREYETLYTVQIAAYLSREDAEALAAQLRGRGLPIWTVNVRVDGRDWTRVRVGASPDLAEARDLGRWITRSYNSPVWVAPVDANAEPVPADAVDETRRFMIEM